MRVWAVRLAPTLAAIAVVALTVSLGNWQMRRAAEKEAYRLQRERAELTAPLDLAAVGDAEVPAGARVAVTGRFLPAQAVLLDNRTHQGVAGFHLLMPMRLEPGGRILLVMRGWLAADPADRTRVPSVNTPQGEVRLTGYFERELPQPLQLGHEADPGPGDRVWQFFSFEKFRRWSHLPVTDGLIRQTSATDDGLVRDWTPGGPTAGTHYGYAFQWYALALATVLLWIRHGRAAWRTSGLAMPDSSGDRPR